MIRRAVVLGAGVAGLAAARAIADAFDEVVVVERDALPDQPVARAGVPQGHHVHVLLVRGKRDLERLFPGFGARMRDAGALDLDFGEAFATLRRDGWEARGPRGFRTLFASRPLTEWVIRGLLASHGHVRIRARTRVTAIALDRVRGQRRAIGVELDGRDELAAELVIDATGRAARGLALLAARGVAAPPASEVDPLLGYASRMYETRPRTPDVWWRGVWIDPRDPDRDRLVAVLLPIERGRFIVTLAGFSGNYPPTDEPGFDRALTMLRSPLIAEAVACATPLGPVHGSRSTGNVLRHLDHWPDAPQGFLAVGDAASAFNPVYGQGMSCAAATAELLRAIAGRGPGLDLAAQRRFVVAQAAFLDGPWRLATSADFRLAATVGERPVGARLLRRYMEAFHQCANVDPVVRRRRGEITNLVAPPGTVLSPPIAARVLLHWLRTRAGSPTAVLVPPTRSEDRP